MSPEQDWKNHELAGLSFVGSDRIENAWIGTREEWTRYDQLKKLSND